PSFAGCGRPAQAKSGASFDPRPLPEGQAWHSHSPEQPSPTLLTSLLQGLLLPKNFEEPFESEFICRLVQSNDCSLGGGRHETNCPIACCTCNRGCGLDGDSIAARHGPRGRPALRDQDSSGISRLEIHLSGARGGPAQRYSHDPR